MVPVAMGPGHPWIEEWLSVGQNEPSQPHREDVSMSSLGFNNDYRVAQRSNGLAIAGFIIAIIGLITGGTLSIVGLVLCLVALKDEPRGFAWAGVIISLFGFCAGAVLLIMFGSMLLVALGIATIAMANFADPIKLETTAEMAFIVARAEEVRQRDGYPPASLSALGLDDGVLRDPWGNRYRYLLTDENERGYEIISDGPDGHPETDDDVEFSQLGLMWGEFANIRVATEDDGQGGGTITVRAGAKTFTIRGDERGGSIVLDDGDRVIEIVGGPDGSHVRTRSSSDSTDQTSGMDGGDDGESPPSGGN